MTGHIKFKFLSTRNVLSLLVFCVFTAFMASQWSSELQVFHVYMNGSSLTFTPPPPAKLSTNQTTNRPTLARSSLLPVSAIPATNIPTTTSTQPVLTTSRPMQAVCKNHFREEYLKKRNYLCSRPLGRLGNMMFVYASSYGIATYNNRTLIMDTGFMLTDYFNLNVQLVDDFECVIRGTKGLGPRQACAFEESLMHIAKGENVCLGSYLQSYKYFEHVQDSIKTQFTFKKDISDKAMRIIDGAINTLHKHNGTVKDTRPVLVGVHVRRGDMVKHKFGFTVATPEYLGNASQYYRNKYPNTLFIVCSNDMAWTKKHFVGDDVFYVEGNTFDVDMAVLVKCDHSLTTVGSFSWWAGFLAGGEVVYYQWPAIEKSGLRRHFSADYKDFFPPPWIDVLSLLVFWGFTAFMASQWSSELQVFHVYMNGSSLTFTPPPPAKLSTNQTTNRPTLARSSLLPVSAIPATNIPTTTSTQPVLTTSRPMQAVCKNHFREEYLKKRNYLCSRPLGRLGNMMFVYASSYGIATYNNRTLIMDTGFMLTDYFNLNVQLVDDFECVIRGTKTLGPRRDCAFEKSLMHIAKGENVCFQSYLQSYKYFEHVQDSIKKQFTFKKDISDKAMRIIDGAINTFHKRNGTVKDTRPVLVGVHVRRGDMVKNTYGFAVATPEYLGNASQYYRDKYPNTLFIVCSNGMAWTKKHFVGDDVFYVEGNTFDVDMAVLVNCDHSLTTVGSFSWWAGFLAGGEVVYYQWPAIEKSRLRRHFSANYTDFFPPSWIGMK